MRHTQWVNVKRINEWFYPRQNCTVIREMKVAFLAFAARPIRSNCAKRTFRLCPTIFSTIEKNPSTICGGAIDRIRSASSEMVRFVKSPFWLSGRIVLFYREREIFVGFAQRIWIATVVEKFDATKICAWQTFIAKRRFLYAVYGSSTFAIRNAQQGIAESVACRTDSIYKVFLRIAARVNCSNAKNSLFLFRNWQNQISGKCVRWPNRRQSFINCMQIEKSMRRDFSVLQSPSKFMCGDNVSSILSWALKEKLCTTAFCIPFRKIISHIISVSYLQLKCLYIVLNR